jgi:hypothetical protein
MNSLADEKNVRENSFESEETHLVLPGMSIPKDTIVSKQKPTR